MNELLTIEEHPTQVQVIEDSISDEGIRLVSVQTRYWRSIHSELMTHRVFSRNARSSRAVPTPKLLREPIFMPKFQKNMAGMQAGEDLDENQAEAERAWSDLAEMTRRTVQQLHDLGVHKQWANRPLEWFGFIDVLVTSTDWTNFYNLRDHPDATPEIRTLARAIHDAIDMSAPTRRHSWQQDSQEGWHLPYITPEERVSIPLLTLQRISVARCARISYKPFEGEEASIEADMRLYEKLVVNDPLHASPAEHQATPDNRVVIDLSGGTLETWGSPKYHGNLYGWQQFRKMLPNENYADPHYHS